MALVPFAPFKWKSKLTLEQVAGEGTNPLHSQISTYKF